MEAIPTNSAIFSGRGFLPRPRCTGPVDVVAGSVRGRDDLDRLRHAALVRVVAPPPERATLQDSDRFGVVLDEDSLMVRTVLWLALAGVPVTGHNLSASVRSRLDPDLLTVLDSVDTRAVSDPGERELISLALRRRARLLTAHPLASTRPAIAVLLPPGDLSPLLAGDLDRQTWESVIRCPAPDGDSETATATVAAARARGAVYTARMDPAVRYGPFHLADLVDALRHSGARVAHTPLRFNLWHPGAWLEDESAVGEGRASALLPHASLWYAEDGATPPSGSPDAYVAHGTNAVPRSHVPTPEVVALRLHPERPRVLGWLSGPDTPTPPAADQRTAWPASYFA